MMGYLHQNYALALAASSKPLYLRRCRGWLLERTIPGTSLTDAIGCYPLFACKDWSSLALDLDEIDRSVVSVTAVTDPFGAFDEEALLAAFPDLIRPYKAHFLIDLSKDPKTFVTKHHQRNARKALERLSIEICRNPADYMQDWLDLYAILTARHKITGRAAFSRDSFARQIEVPGLTMLRASYKGRTVGLNLWFMCDDRSYYHLGAYSDLGYNNFAAFGLFWIAIEHFALSGLRWLGLGASAGQHATDNDGLSRFKRGWATDTRTVYLCGRICNRPKYNRLKSVAERSLHPFFPEYRTNA
jgi:hypothetical protein